MMESLKITVKGIVQKVGYRNQVFHIARRMKIKGYVRNLDDADESVEILAQHPERSVLDAFIRGIRIDDGFIIVENVLVEEVASGAAAKFELVRGSPEEENAERLDTAAYHLNTLTVETREGFERLGDRMDAGFENLGSKMDAGFGNLGNKVDTGFENLGNKMDDGFENLGNKVDAGFGDLGSKTDDGFGNLGNKMDSTDGKLDLIHKDNQVVISKLDSFSGSTSSRFDVVDSKYGKISDRLERISASLDKLVKIVERFVPHGDKSGE